MQVAAAGNADVCVTMVTPKSFSRSVPIFSDMFEKDLLIGICTQGAYFM